MDMTTDARILSSSHAWSATPWEYSSMRMLCFLEDGGEVDSKVDSKGSFLNIDVICTV